MSDPARRGPNSAEAGSLTPSLTLSLDSCVRPGRHRTPASRREHRAIAGLSSGSCAMRQALGVCGGGIVGVDLAWNREPLTRIAVGSPFGSLSLVHGVARRCKPGRREAFRRDAAREFYEVALRMRATKLRTRRMAASTSVSTNSSSSARRANAAPNGPVRSRDLAARRGCSGCGRPTRKPRGARRSRA